MHLSRIDLNLLVVFDVVNGAGSITAASRQLNLSQPAVSHALARLRELLGDPLFERQGRGIAPTPFARSIAGPIRDALGAMERTLQLATRFEPSQAERTFRVGLREALEPSVLPLLAQAVCGGGPGLDLACARHDRARLESDLAVGEFDVAFDVRLPAFAERIPHERVLVDRLVIVARKHHPVLRRLKRRGWNVDAYLALDHVQVSSRRRGPSLEDLALQDAGKSRRVRLRCQSHAAACRAVAATDLVATIPESYARQVLDPQSNQLVTLPLDDITLETYMYWPANADHDAANCWLRDQVRAALGGG